MIPQQRVGRWLAVGALIAIAAATLLPLPHAPPQPVRICLVCGQFGGRDVVLNILLFAPLGLGLRLAAARVPPALAVIIGTTVVVELLQYLVIPGRDASVGDIAMNTTGGVLGLLLGGMSRALVHPASHQASSLALLATVAVGLVLTTSAWGAHFSDADAIVYWGQWAHDFPRRARFHGRVLSASVVGVPLPDGAMPGITETLRARLRGGEPDIESTVIPGRPTGGNAPVVTLTNGARTEVLALEQHGRDLVFHAHLNAGRLRLGMPVVRLRQRFPPDASSPGAADTVRLRGALRSGELLVEYADGDSSTVGILRLGPWTGWAFLAPFSAMFDVFAWLTALWAFSLLVPSGYWSARVLFVREPHAIRHGVLVTGMHIIVIAAIEVGDGYATNVPALLCASAGLATGLCLGRWSVRREAPRVGWPG